MSRYQKGLKVELELSKKLHNKNIPFLISSQFLRSFGCGQVDIAYLSKGRLVLVESKSGGGASGKQFKRLRASQELLSKVLDYPVILEFIIESELPN